MPSRPIFKQEKSFSENAFELQPYGNEAAAARSDPKYPEATLAEDYEEKHKSATANDQRDMDRLGKKQELRVSRAKRVSSSRHN